MKKILIIGAGIMGTALSVHLSKNGHEVNLWGTQWDREIIDRMEKTKKHDILDVDIPKKVKFYYEEELDQAFEDTELVIIAVVAKGMDYIAKKINPYLDKNHIILTVTKGLDDKSLSTMTKLVENSLPEDLKDHIDLVKLGGPIIAKELANGKYTEGIFACKNIDTAKFVSHIFKSPSFRTNITSDIKGVEVCASFKNVYAIAMGIIDGIDKDSNNSKAAIMARGSLEMANIIEAFGGKQETALGIAGVGDYYVTSQSGRNGKFGRILSQGKSIQEALEIMDNATVEGISMTLNGYNLLSDLVDKGKFDFKKDAPLFLEIYNILYQGKDIRQAINNYWNGNDFE